MQSRQRLHICFLICSAGDIKKVCAIGEKIGGRVFGSKGFPARYTGGSGTLERLLTFGPPPAQTCHESALMDRRRRAPWPAGFCSEIRHPHIETDPNERELTPILRPERGCAPKRESLEISVQLPYRLAGRRETAAPGRVRAFEAHA
jgi:hypothetical protein